MPSDVIKTDTTVRAPDHSTVRIQNGGPKLPCGFNFAPVLQGDILKCACVEFICTEGISAFSKRIRRCRWTGENDTKTMSIDANLFEQNSSGRFRLKTD